MDLGLNEFQEKTKETARAFLAGACSSEALREMEESDTGHSPDLWRKIAELGWPALGIAEEYGGLGGSLIDVAVIVEEMGYAAYAGPYVPTAVWAAYAVREGASGPEKERILAGVATGSKLMSVAIAEPEGVWSPAGVSLTVASEGDTLVLNGEKRFVDYAAVADEIVVFGRAPGSSGADGIEAVVVDAGSPGISVTDMKATAGRQYAVRFDGVKARAERSLRAGAGAGALLPAVVEAGTAMQCVFSAGIARRALDMTVSHALERTQFGQPLGKFQAVQHMCADMAMLTEGARLIAYEALWRVDAGLPARKEVAMAKAFTNEATRQTLWMAHQIHGGIGIMQEYDLHFYFRLAKALEHSLGITRDFLEIVADELELGGRA